MSTKTRWTVDKINFLLDGAHGNKAGVRVRKDGRQYIVSGRVFIAENTTYRTTLKRCNTLQEAVDYLSNLIPSIDWS